MDPKTIQFSDAAHPTRSHDARGIGGVVPLRGRSISRSRNSLEAFKAGEVENAEDEDAGLRDERDFKRSQVRAYTTGAKPAY